MPFYSSIVNTPEQALDLCGNILESSTQYSIIAADFKGTIVLWNEGARRLYGYEPEEVVGKANFSMLHTAEDVLAGKPREILDAVLREGQWEGTVTRPRKDGSRFTARVVVTPRRDSSGRAIGYLLISKDISNEIRLKEELKATQLYSRSLIESSIDALMTTNPEGVITDVNRQTEALTGCTREELIGTPFKIYFTEPARATQGIETVLRDGRVTDYELALQSKDGQTTVVSYNASTFQDLYGRLQGVFAAARDVTERKRFEKALQEKNIELENANHAKDRFLASMSHELRTPLNAIIGFTGTLLMELPGPLVAEQQKQLRTVQSSARHLLSLINDLLDLVKIESGKVQLSVEPVGCQTVIDEIATALRPSAEGKGLVFEVGSANTEVVVHTDRRAVSQILLNLTNNAIKFTDRGRVTIALRERAIDGQAAAEIVVSDTGCGIKPHDQAKLFQAFTQLAARSTDQSSTGLGLHLSAKLADLIGARIIADSEYGVGSTFTLLLMK